MLAVSSCDVIDKMVRIESMAAFLTLLYELG